MLWLKITTKGKTAHGSMPHLGINAVLSMNKLLNKLSGFVPEFTRHPLLGDCSLSINTISGGKAINVIPDSCEVSIDIRTVPSQQHEKILSQFTEIINALESEDENFQADISIDRQVPALETDTGSEFIRKFCASLDISETKPVGFTTDAPYFASLGAPAVIFGAGDPHLCHKPDEYIEIKDLQKAADMYQKAILDCLQ
jgi:succinyl-diaminopimelate desuccinylase